MIAEFAIEPRVMAKWRHFQRFYGDFGVPAGRVIGRYPGDWTKQVAVLAHQFAQDMTNRPVDAKRIEERLASKSFGRKVVPAGRPYDRAVPWLANALGLPEEQAFRAVIAEVDGATHPALLNPDEFLDDHPLYRADTTAKIPRTAKALVACALPLLRVSEELVLVDPNFRVRNAEGARVDRFVETLRELLSQWQRMRRPNRRIELHLQGAGGSTDAATLQRDLTQGLARCVPKGLEMSVFLWQTRRPGERLHPRFILTDYGGIMYDYGLDVGGPGERTVVSLLSEQHWTEVRQDYCRGSTTFELDEDRDILRIKGAW